MTRLRVFCLRIAGFLRPHRLEREMAEELEFHLQMEIEQNVRRGMEARVARSAALRRFGGLAQTREIYRETGGLPMLDTLRQDVRFGFRTLRRNPAFAAVAIFCLTLGIGANASVFSWMEGILLRPYPLVRHQERLMAIAGINRGTPGHDDVSWPDFQDLEKDCGSCEAFIVDRISGTTLTVGERAERSPMSLVSANYFDALGVRPVLGRGFEAAEDIGRNGRPVTVISYRMWQERFHGDPRILGRTQLLNNIPYTIVGVAPRGFYGTFVGYAINFWVPLSMQELFDRGSYSLEDRGARFIEGFVLLKPGVSAGHAQTELSAIAGRLEHDYPDTNRGRGVQLYPLWKTPFNGASTMGPSLGIAMAVAAGILLIACANVSNLLLARSFARRHEMMVRMAIGSARRRLLQQLLTEGLILSGLSAAAGFLVAYSCRDLFAAFFPARGGLSLFLPGSLDWRVFALSAGACIVSTALFALVPALESSRVDLAGALRAESGGVVGGGRRELVRSGLVLVQVALSFLLLVGAGLLFQASRAVQRIDPGFSTRAYTTYLDFSSAGYTPDRIASFQDEFLERLRAFPAIEKAAFARMTPFAVRGYSSAPISIEGYEQPEGQLTIDYDEIGPDYFAALTIPLLSGREFTRLDNETAPPVAVVNELMAQRYWPGRDATGQRFQMRGRWVTVVGVAKMSKYRNLTERPQPFFYVPMRQSAMGLSLELRTSLGGRALAAILRREAHTLDPNLPLGEVIPMREQVDRTTALGRIAASMLAVFGALALVLAAIGLYGVMAYKVSQSRREMGLRMALGADTSDLLRRVVSQGLSLAAAGIVLGALASLSLTRLIVGLLYQVSPRDPAVFAGAGILLIATSLAASFVPAWRAAQTDPVTALRL
jgi:macrolide transport system ATP-binding/permease protein